MLLSPLLSPGSPLPPRTGTSQRGGGGGPTIAKCKTFLATTSRESVCSGNASNSVDSKVDKPNP